MASNSNSSFCDSKVPECATIDNNATHYKVLTMKTEMHGGIPFELKARQPNAATVAAIKELAEGKGHKSHSVDELINELTEGKVQNAQS